MTQILIIGIGNENRGDDSAGLIAARHLRNIVAQDIPVLEMDDPARLIDVWRSAHLVFVIDSSASGSVLGAIRRFEVDQQPLPSIFGAISSHNFGLGATIELARVMDLLPERLVVYAIEGRRYDPCSPPQESVVQAASDVAKAVNEELNEFGRSSNVAVL